MASNVGTMPGSSPADSTCPRSRWKTSRSQAGCMIWANCSSQRILNKSGALTEDEFAVIRTHPQIGADVLRAIPEIERLAEAVESHHEAFDGSGYPLGLKGEVIPLYGRILAVADAYANMTSDRSFAVARTEDQALAELQKLSGTRFDGMIVRVFARLLQMERPRV